MLARPGGHHTLRRMLRFLVRRLVLAILVCLTVLVVSFTLTRLSGDIAISIAGPNATARGRRDHPQELRVRPAAAGAVHRLGGACRTRAISGAPISTTHRWPG